MIEGGMKQRLRPPSRQFTIDSDVGVSSTGSPSTTMMQPAGSPRAEVFNDPNGSTTPSSKIAVKGDLWGIIEKTTHNFHLPVFRVPPEVLEAIFLRLLQVIRASSPHGTAEPGSFNFLFVCRHWYEVAINAQNLWCYWDSKTERWSTFLDRSKRAPLHLRFFSNVAQDWGKKPAEAAAEMFQSLEVQSRFIDVDFHGARLFVDMYLGLSKNWSRPEYPSPLKSFRLRTADGHIVSRGMSHTPIVVPSHYWLKLFPELDELELRDCRCDWDAPIFFTSSLRRLAIVCRDPFSNPKMLQIESMIYHNRALDHLELSAPTGCQPSQTLSPSLPFLRTLGVSGMLPDAIKLLQYLNSPRTLERLDLVLITDVFGELDFGGPFLRGFHAQRATIRWVDVELKNSSIVVRSFNSLDNATEPFSVIEIVQGRSPQPPGTRLWQKLNIYAVCSAALPLESVEKLSVRGEGQYKAGWSRNVIKLFEVLSPTLREIEAFVPGLALQGPNYLT
ncbi:hypothetical protein BDM02DRAFT_679645 [Thelephora ganbajun]|uniref:Uncharacterized protein n=1 Tax=Thelephora ganbajun TaxID=370292 RepID=A0ACB6ZPB2_THEGA|nr:hypothetical protein BDM02DRAFT_679645 [Thelephora ganbajun]